jgi:hypothetical protein
MIFDATKINALPTATARTDFPETGTVKQPAVARRAFACCFRFSLRI